MNYAQQQTVYVSPLRINVVDVVVVEVEGGGVDEEGSRLSDEAWSYMRQRCAHLA